MPRRKSQIIRDMEATIGKRIQAVRQARGLSLARLGAMIGTSGYQLRKYETALDTLSIGRLLLIAKALNINPNYFYQELPEELKIMPVIEAVDDTAVIELVNNFMRIKNPRDQELVHQSIKAWAELS